MNIRELAKALRLIGGLLDLDQCHYVWEGRFRFDIAPGWYLVVSSDCPGRLRLDTWHSSGRSATLWTRAADRARLQTLVLAAKNEALALTV